MCQRISNAVVWMAGLACATIAQAGPDWVEGDHGDAGSLPKTSQPINMTPTGGLNKISGRLAGQGAALVGGDDFEDMYKFHVIEPVFFCATTACVFGKGPCGSAEFDSQLWLFDGNGRGLLGNDNTLDNFIVGSPPQVSGSTLGGSSCDGTGSMILMPGDYYLAVTSFNFPVSGSGAIFCFGCPHAGSTCTPGNTEVSGPDGDGGDDPITAWNTPIGLGGGVGPCLGCGNYVIEFCADTAGVVSDTIQAKMDIKPGGCPNPFNRTSNGVLPVSLVGTPTFNVHDVDLSTVKISRSDAVGGNLAPHEGPPGPHSVYEDNATPFTGVECGCTSASGDGITDLSMKFKSDLLVTALQLNDLPAGALVPLKITGHMNNGDPFEAEDCIRLVPPGTPPGLIAVQSLSSTYVEANPPDLTLDTGGFGNFQRTYPITTQVTLKATLMVPGQMFAGWRVDNSSQLIPNQQITVSVSTATHTYTAVYVTANNTPR